MQCPKIDPQLIRYLDEIFPDCVVDPTRENPAVRFGNVAVVRHLKMQLQQQQEGDVDVRP